MNIREYNKYIISLRRRDAKDNQNNKFIQKISNAIRT